MAAILEAVFRRHGCSTTTSSGDASVLCHSSTECSSVVVVGERGVSSALLFLTAVTAATELGHRVMFYTHTAIQKFPIPVKESVTSLKPDSLKKIQFVYPRSLEDLLLNVASLHEQASGAAAAPSLVLVDGLDAYLRGMGEGARGPQREEMSATAHLAALLTDTSSFFNPMHEKAEASRGTDRGAALPCRVIVSFHSDWEAATTDPVLSVLDRYIPTRCTLVQDLRSMAGGDELLHDWQVHLSGAGVSPGAANRLQWHLAVHANGAMKFSLTSKLREPRDSDQQREGVQNQLHST
ncbi:ATPase SWSAP1 [Alosa sapidissima]|uniref:ATPase SWSAP1 n=1 Tax=Alosa sapidissima TaxID=34773 RepID=UPI001C0A3C78|nr:ATPase SWSAP1 [Alosa sapidissima]